MFETETIFLLGLGLSPILLLAVAICSTQGPKRAPLVWCGSKPSQPIFIPSAEETAESVQRFREAAERSMMVDFIWDRYSKGRAIFLEDIRKVAGQRKKRASAGTRARISKWL